MLACEGSVCHPIEERKKVTLRSGDSCSPDADLENTAEVLGIGCDKCANVNDQLLLQHGLDRIKWKTSVVQDPLYVVW